MITTDLRKTIERKKGEKNLLLKKQDTAFVMLEKLQEKALHVEEAKTIIQMVARQTQEELKYHIEEIVTLALASIFPDPYQFEIEFVVRRDNTECDLFFTREGSRVKPINAAGGGVVDVASFALRVAIWNLQRPRTRGTLILDEPFRFVSQNLRTETSQFLHEVSEKLGLQIIMVTHDSDLIECADRVFNVTQKKGVSKIREVG